MTRKYFRWGRFVKISRVIMVALALLGGTDPGEGKEPDRIVDAKTFFLDKTGAVSLEDWLVRFTVMLQWEVMRQDISPETARNQFRSLYDQLVVVLKGEQDPAARARKIRDFLFQQEGFQADRSRIFESGPETLSLANVLKSKKGNCLSLSLVYLYLSDRLRLPVRGVIVPRHFFLRYDDGKEKFNIETTAGGAEFNDDYYLAMIPGPPERARSLREVDSREALTVYLAGIANQYKVNGQFDPAIEILQDALTALPDCTECLVNLGNVYERSGRYQEADQQYRLAIGQDPYLCEAHYNLGLLHFLYTKNYPLARREGQIAAQLGCRLHPRYRAFLEQNR